MFYKLSQKVIPVVRKFIKPPEPNSRGERDIEYSWVLDNFPSVGKEILDFGCGDTFLLPLFAARQGFRVTAIDLKRHVPWSYSHPNLNFIQQDILATNFSSEQFDFIINVSSIEHVGLKGRYGSKERPEGDFEAMKFLRGILKTGSRMVLTVPVGIDAVFSPFHRVYGEKRLPQLLKGWVVEKKEYWIKDDQLVWHLMDEDMALSTEPSEYYYSLGLFVLEK